MAHLRVFFIPLVFVCFPAIGKQQKEIYLQESNFTNDAIQQEEQFLSQPIVHDETNVLESVRKWSTIHAQ